MLSPVQLGDPMDCSLAKHPYPWNSPGKSAGLVGSHPLLQGDLSHEGVETRPPALQVDSVPCEPRVETEMKPRLETERMAHPVASVTPQCPLVFLRRVSVMKRKRGRPKGSTKKPSPEEELAERSALPGADGRVGPRGRGQPGVQQVLPSSLFQPALSSASTSASSC